MSRADPANSLWRSLDDPGPSFEGESGTGPIAITRRDFLRLGAAAAALATGACRGPGAEIVPSVAPRPGSAGEPAYYATSMTLGGVATGLLVRCDEGRPTKVEGNVAHPASLGGTGVFEQAAILELWDPARADSVEEEGRAATIEAFRESLAQRLALAEPRRGEGLRVLLRADASPMLSAQCEALSRRLPAARVHAWDPLHRTNTQAGAERAFGRVVDAVCQLEGAERIVAVDADFIGEGPGHLRYARELVARRRRGDEAMGRLYAVESTPTLAGAMADHRLALPPHAIVRWLGELAAALDGAASSLPMVAAVARDLRAHAGRSLLIAGESLPPTAHALVHRLNAKLDAPGRTVRYIEPVVAPVAPEASIMALCRDMAAGRVESLLVLGGNPAYDAPADAGFAEALARVPWTAHLALRKNETSRRCRWLVPQAHFLEHWSDARAFDGTASVVQPVVQPLRGGRSPHELLAWLAGDLGFAAREVVRARWAGEGGAAAEGRWRQALRDGVVEATAAPTVAVTAREATLEDAPATPWTLVLRADASVHDGEFAPNAWLQEIPRSHSKLVWDNAALVAPRDAAALGVATGDWLVLEAGGRRIEAPAWVLPGQAEGAIALALGYGRRMPGQVGDGVGVDAYALRGSAHPWSASLSVGKSLRSRHGFATTQSHARMEGRDPVHRRKASDPPAPAKAAGPGSLYPDWPYDSYRWAMAIDLTACIGCNACTIACQAENNIPTVGPEEVARGREMHWIRIDRYYEGPEEGPRTHFQPVPCMHCEKAPCEPVCPVGATMHDSEGLNVQVYNRCVGTRFCSNNCPYKVRRFNFLPYAAGRGEPPLEARNPEVTVRMRGVMEKCNYCLQRITRARIASEREGRRLADGEVVTACQSACPTRAIVFGDLADPASAVSQAKASPRDYALLEELGTRPRTTYGARVANPNGEIGEA